MFTLAIDFDGTLVEKGEPLRWRAGARDGLISLASAGHHLILHSCRCNPIDPTFDPALEVAAFYRSGITPESARARWEAFGEMRDFLKGEGAWPLFAEVWQQPGKPLCEMFIDDRSEPPNWVALSREFGVRLKA